MSDELKPTGVEFRLLTDNGDSGTLAFCLITFNDLMIVETRIVRSKKGNLFVSFPQDQDRNNPQKFYQRVRFKDAHLDNTAGRKYSDKIQKWAIEKYHKAREEEQRRLQKSQQTSDTTEAQGDTPPSDW